LLPRSVVLAVGGFDERTRGASDTSMLYRVATRYPIQRVPEPLALYRQHPDQLHLDYRVMLHDMRVIYADAFADPLLPWHVRSRRGRGEAHVHVAVAAAARHDSWVTAGRHLARAFGADPRAAAARAWVTAAARLRRQC
jgi:hypothetical protein